MESINQPVMLANKLIAETNANLFLTGKAGTGKTTFLKKLRESNIKRMIVLAPTGVAAINAGGMTIHSFFQLRFGPFIPNGKREKEGWFRKEKLEIIRTLDLLVIDEISMVRADLLDAIDDALRRIRRSHAPFGGVQLLMIGDMEQLPPVVKEDEWSLLSTYYDSPYFFCSLALKKSQYLSIELTKVYRQSDEKFISILNKIRNSSISFDELTILNKRFINSSNYEHLNPINITTHNSVANQINKTKLDELPSKKHLFEASIWGNFPEYSYPTEKELELKEGAQVMFIRNDNSQEKLYFNGKIGTIISISKNNIIVKDKLGNLIEVEKCKWDNIRYELSPKTKEIEEIIDGTFEQYPLKHAWAITIHKSQGLTFEHAVIDAQNSFAHGQVYVALSRCKSLDGLFLRCPIPMDAIKRDEKLENFSQYVKSIHAEESQLNTLIKNYENQLLIEQFSLENINNILKEINAELSIYYRKKSPVILNKLMKLEESFKTDISNVSSSFLCQLKQLTLNKSNKTFLDERIKKGATYFLERLDTFQSAFDQLPKQEFTDKECEKKVKDLVGEYQKEYNIKIATLTNCLKGFSSKEYLSTKTKILLGNISIKLSQKKKSIHPQLMDRLLDWRSSTANKIGITESGVLPKETIIELSDRLPSNKNQLLQIKKINLQKAKKYGNELLSIIEECCFEFGYKQEENAFDDNSSSQKKDPKGSSEVISLNLFKEGKSVSEIAKLRNLTTRTIENHLIKAIICDELPRNVLISDSQYNHIVSLLEKMGKDVRLTEIKEQLGNKVTWTEIKCAKEYWESKSKGNL